MLNTLLKSYDEKNVHKIPEVDPNGIVLQLVLYLRGVTHRLIYGSNQVPFD